MIRTLKELDEVCTRLRAEKEAALDTEFVWRRTYRPSLALVQLGARDGTSWVEDCLQGFSPQPLGDLLADPQTVKILHDAHQDLEHLYHYTGAQPVNVFDTQLAAAFAGFPAGLSLQGQSGGNYGRHIAEDGDGDGLVAASADRGADPVCAR